jgi:replicative DNA helicase
MTNKDIALSYLNKGLSVIPLWSREQIKRKPPRYFVDELNKQLDANKESDNPIPEDDIYENYVIRVCKRAMILWTEFQTRHPTVAEVADWFTKWPDANIGIVTGNISNLVVFDLDSENAVQYAENEGGFPVTVKAKTGKGYHIYAQHPGFAVKNDVEKKLDIDIRGDGGYAAAPPSVHGSGRQYEWEDGLSIVEIDPAPCDSWMIDYLKEVSRSSSKPAKEKTPNLSNNPDMAKKSGNSDSYVDILKYGAREGMRNHTATKLIGHLIAKGNDEAVVWELIKQWNAEKNNPSLDEFELRKTFDSIAKLESQNQDQQEKIDVADFFDTTKRIIAEHDESFIKIPFAADNLSNLETYMNGGLIGGRFYLLGGIPSASKTMLANNIADNICLNGNPVLFFSYDDGKAELRYRTFARFSKNDIEDFNQNRLDKSLIKNICAIRSLQKIRKLKGVIESTINVEKWDDLIEQAIKLKGKPPVIMVDYLRKLRTESGASDERLRVDGILSNLTGLAKKYNIPVLAISELARDSYKSGQRLSMASFKESGTIEYEASWLGILAAVEEKDGQFIVKKDWERMIQQDGNIDLIVFKAKRGAGITGKIPLKVDRNKMTVSDRVDRTHVEEAAYATPPSIFGTGGV